jgi:phospholipid/cholesterol/gamma-HCH transport system substrate-binding protein
MLPSFRDFDRLKLGIAGIVVIGAVLVAVFAVGTLGVFEDRYAASAVFEDTAGLGGGAKVRMAGVVIGEVTGVTPDFESGQVIVDFEIDRGIDLGTEMGAEVAIGTLLGGQYLRLEGDTAPDARGRHLADLPRAERRIPLERTQVPFTIIEALSDAAIAVEDIDGEALSDAVRALADITTRDADDVSSLVANLAVVTSAIQARDADLRTLVESSQQVTATLASRDQQLVALIDSANVLLAQISNRRDELAALLGNGSEAVQTLAELLQSQQANLDNILGDAHLVLDRVDANLPVINDTLAWVGPTFTALAVAGTHGPWFDVVVTGLGPLGIGVLLDLLEPLLAEQGP